MSDIVDLTGLIPEPTTIRIGDPAKEIQVLPPKTSNLLRLGSLGQKMSEASGLSGEELDKLVGEITNEVKKCIPELGDIELNTAQLLKLVEIISAMGMPTEAKELEKRGISSADPKAE